MLHIHEVAADSDPKQSSRERFRPQGGILRTDLIRAGRNRVPRFIARARRSSSARVLAEKCATVIADVVEYYDPYPVTKEYADRLSAAVAQVLKPAMA